MVEEKYELSEADREIIDALRALEKDSGKSARQFAADHLTYSETVWGRVQSGEYFKMVSDPEKVIITLRRDLGRLQREMALSGRYTNTEWKQTDEARAIFKAMDACRVKPMSDPNRLILYLAPTGGGKSQLCGQAVKRHNAKVVEARESWLRGYFTCLRDIGTALGVKVEKIYTPDALEDEIIEALIRRKTTLAIDEGEFFSARSLNLIKLFLNKTPTVILLCAIPEAYEAWTKANSHEARQVRRRTHAVIRLSPIHPDMAAKFLTGLKISEAQIKPVCVVLSKFANAFGHFDMINRMVADLHECDKVDVDELKKIGNAIRAEMDLPPISFEGGK
ncbi:MAG TPA: AAA family ATPase [Verrucomicrobiae bacterium]|nr:AAA family ATPase [Verrucomicrobiae bacterium]